MAITISGNSATTRTNLGTGTSATLDTGTSANNVVLIDSDGKLPNVDASNVTGLTNSLKWNLPAFYAYNNGNESLVDATWTLVTDQFNTTTINTDNCYNTTTGKFQPTTAGYYYVEGQMHADCGSGQLVNLFAAIIIDDTAVPDEGLVTQAEANEGTGNANEQSVNVSALIYLNGTTNYLQMKYYNDDTTGTGTMVANHGNFMGFLVKAGS
jgi:hypothetical protein